MSDENQATIKKNFIRDIIEKEIASNKHGGKVITRFPPEPNGYLHIGSAKSICLNFGIAEDYKGICNLRLDDTNPEKERKEYIDAIQEDIKWLGFDIENKVFFASDYYQTLCDYAIKLIQKGSAYVCHLTPEETREYRGTLTQPGKNSPYRDRTPQENLELFQKMKNGEFADGHCVLRAKIDMSSSNMNMRDPLMYRIKKVPHPRTGTDWVIYPLYDFTHGLSDAIEGVTHSICTLEFEDHRPLYDWFIDEVEPPCKPQQIEFSKLNINYTVMGKRNLIEMVELGLVKGWDDPRLPTLRGLRRRGFSAKGLRNFIDQTGATKNNTVLDMGMMETYIRDDLNDTTKRVMGVLDPIKVTITNYPKDEQETLQASWHPKKEDWGKRNIPFGHEIYIDRDDFMENPPGKYRRLKPGGQVRLRYAYVIECTEVIKDDTGKVIELKCTYFSDTKSGKTPEGMKKVKGIIHWVSAHNNIEAEVRLYDRLFTVPTPTADKEHNYKEFINKDSLKVISKAYIEKNIESETSGTTYQFERLGYFTIDKDSSTKKPVLNRTITLKDTWGKK